MICIVYPPLQALSCACPNSWISAITFFNTLGGLLELWLPSKIYRCLFFPAQSWQSFQELRLSMRMSSSPDRNINIVFRLIFLTDSAISKSSISQWPSYSMSDRILQNTQGNKQLMRQLGIYPGVWNLANCLHRPLKDLKAESATIMLAFPKRRPVTAPMLLPQITILQFFSFRKSTTVSTCCAYLYPKLMVSSQQLRPQPMKSNEAKEYLCGRYSRMEQDSIFEEELPWRQRITQPLLWSGSKTVSSSFLPLWSRVYSDRTQTSSLRRKLFEAMWFQSYLPEGHELWISEV